MVIAALCSAFPFTGETRKLVRIKEKDKYTNILQQNPFWSAKHLRLGQDLLSYRKGQFINMMNFPSFNAEGLLETKCKSLCSCFLL